MITLVIMLVIHPCSIAISLEDNLLRLSETIWSTLWMDGQLCGFYKQIFYCIYGKQNRCHNMFCRIQKIQTIIPWIYKQEFFGLVQCNHECGRNYISGLRRFSMITGSTAVPFQIKTHKNL